MEKTKIYLIRHGESEGNLKNVFLGFTDLDLTELGHRQAEKSAEYLKALPVSAIYSSDLIRAYHTALHTAEKCGLEVRRHRGLREIFAGEWEGKPFQDLVEKYPDSFGVWFHDFYQSRCAGGESVSELQERVTCALREIAEENKGKTVFVFTHATPIRVFCAAAQNLMGQEVNAFPWPSNASVSCVEYEEGTFRLIDYSLDHFMGDMVTRLPEKND